MVKKRGDTPDLPIDGHKLRSFGKLPGVTADLKGSLLCVTRSLWYFSSQHSCRRSPGPVQRRRRRGVAARPSPTTGYRPGGPGAHRQLRLRRCRRGRRGCFHLLLAAPYSHLRWRRLHRCRRRGRRHPRRHGGDLHPGPADQGRQIIFVVIPVAQSGASPGHQGRAAVDRWTPRRRPATC
jgi:hypothetical protein